MKDQKKLKVQIEKEIHQLIKHLDDGTLNRRKLESGLKKLQKHVVEIPWFRADLDKKS